MSWIKGRLHFSPKYTFEQIETALMSNDIDCLIKAIKDRVDGFYLEPAKKLNCLNKDDYAFAIGVLCVSTIDLLACVTCRPQIPCKRGTVTKRFEGWVRKNLNEFDKPDPADSRKTLAYRFYDEFRNGLVHEGRIKKGGQFSNLSEEIVDTSEGVMLVNPEILLRKINDSFEIYISKIEEDSAEFDKLEDYLENLIRN